MNWTQSVESFEKFIKPSTLFCSEPLSGFYNPKGTLGFAEAKPLQLYSKSSYFSNHVLK